MSYNFSANRIASEVRDSLPQLVTDAKKTAPPEEHSLIELAGQAAYVALQGIDNDSLIELQAYGSDTSSVGARTFYVSINARAIRTKATDAGPAKLWSPDQGPLMLRKPVDATAPAAEATNDSVK
jgi:hypothetical protein